MASWLRDVQVTDVTNTSAIILYTIADCVVNELDNSEIELIITDSPVIDPSSPVLYKNGTDGNFSLSELQPNDVLTYTLQVITEAMGSTVTIGMIHTGSFTVSPTPSSTTTSTTSTVSPLTTPSLGIMFIIMSFQYMSICAFSCTMECIILYVCTIVVFQHLPLY